MRTEKGKLARRDALRVETAEKWLQAGKPARAMKQLQQLTHGGWTHPWTENVLWRASIALCTQPQLRASTFVPQAAA